MPGVIPYRGATQGLGPTPQDMGPNAPMPGASPIAGYTMVPDAGILQLLTALAAPGLPGGLAPPAVAFPPEAGYTAMGAPAVPPGDPLSLVPPGQAASPVPTKAKSGKAKSPGLKSRKPGGNGGPQMETKNLNEQVLTRLLNEQVLQGLGPRGIY